MEQTKYDVFISYSRKDYVDEQKNIIPNNEVLKIKKALTKAGITYWFDEEGVYSGDEFAKVIVKNIKASRVFVFLSTKNSNQSEWTASEISTAHMMKKKIIPVRIDDSVYHDDVILYISRLSHVDYNDNPEKGRKELIRSINGYLEEEKAIAARKAAEKKQEQELLERHRREQEEAKKRQAEIDKLEVDISVLESQKVEREKNVLQKEQELKLAQVDLKACEAKIQKLQIKVEKLRLPHIEYRKKMDENRDKRRAHTLEGTEEMNLFFGMSKVAVEGLRQNAYGVNIRSFNSKSDVFAYVKSNSECPASLSNKDSINNISWTTFSTKLKKEYGLVIDKTGISNIKELVNSIWNASKK